MPEALAPVILFVYNRPDHTQATIDALSRNFLATESELYVFSDGAKRPEDNECVRQVRDIVQKIQGFKKVNVFLARENHGLAQSIISGVSMVIKNHGRAIILEDDLLTLPHFLSYMNVALQRYEKNEQIMQISGYMFPVEYDTNYDAAFLTFGASWGWATWERAWRYFDEHATGWERLLADPELRNRFDLEGTYNYSQLLVAQMHGKIDSWALRWYWSMFCRNGLILYPAISLVQNIGFDGSGTHCSGSESGVFLHADFQQSISLDKNTWNFPEQIERSINAHNAVVKFFAKRLMNGLSQSLHMQNQALMQLQAEKQQLQNQIALLQKNEPLSKCHENCYCTLFDSAYLIQGLALYESIRSSGESFQLFVVCFDDLAYEILRKMHLPNMTLINLPEIETEEVLQVKQNRSRGEYCWTCKSVALQFCIEKYGLKEITYLDSDLFFFQKPSVLLEELRKSDCSVALSPHNFSSVYQWQAQTSGIYCAGFMTFKSDERGMKILSWWRDKCLDWCFAQFDQVNQRFGDQKYLDKWPETFEGVHALRNKGAGVAPWNLQQCVIEQGPRVNSEPIVFFHFSDFKWLNDNRILLAGNYLIVPSAIAFIYEPYIRELHKQAVKVREIDPSFSRERVKVCEPGAELMAPKTFMVRAFIE